MLGVERGNDDVLIFFILSIVIFLLGKKSQGSSITAFIFLLFSFLLKLFPIFGFGYLLREKPKFFLLLSFVVIFLGATYAIY